jgi:ABC-type multidrug transport system ATPase subunit
MSAILKLSGVSKRFGALLAIDNLSMHLNEGDALGVIGPDGSGKTARLCGSARPDGPGVSWVAQSFRAHLGLLPGRRVAFLKLSPSA